MKYKLINKQTGEEHICDKVTIDGMDYYVSNHFLRINDYGYWEDAAIISQINDLTAVLPETKKVIATNNPNIDVPKVVDEVEKWINETTSTLKDGHTIKTSKMCLKAGYNKSQETHPFSEEDMIDFAKKCCSFQNTTVSKNISQEQMDELLQLWKEQQPETLYYE